VKRLKNSFLYASEDLFYANFMLPKPSRIYKIHNINFYKREWPPPPFISFIKKQEKWYGMPSLNVIWLKKVAPNLPFSYSGKVKKNWQLFPSIFFGESQKYERGAFAPPIIWGSQGFGMGPSYEIWSCNPRKSIQAEVHPSFFRCASISWTNSGRWVGLWVGRSFQLWALGGL